MSFPLPGRMNHKKGKRMKQKNILVLLQEAKDKQDILVFLKSAALEFKEVCFYIQCEDKEYAFLSDYHNIQKAESDKKTDYDFVFTFREEDKDRLLPFLGKERRKYLLLLDEKEEDSLLNADYLKAERFVKDMISGNPVVSLISPLLKQKLPQDNRSLELRTESIRSLFESKADMMVLSLEEYRFFVESVDGFLAFCKKEKEKSKNLFSSMGSYFFKNYMPRNEEKRVEDCFDFYEILLDKPGMEILIRRPSEIRNYLDLLRSLMEEKE